MTTNTRCKCCEQKLYRPSENGLCFACEVYCGAMHSRIERLRDTLRDVAELLNASPDETPDTIERHRRWAKDRIDDALGGRLDPSFRVKS